MIVQCPHCGKSVVVNGLGRKPFNMPVKNVCDALQASGSIMAAANSLGCSRAYIYKVLKANRLKLKDVKGNEGNSIYPSRTNIKQPVLSLNITR